MNNQITLNSGTIVSLNDSFIEIIREDSKSAAKSLFAGRTMGRMLINKKSISGIIFNADYLLICASGLPTPSDFKISNVADVKQYPNCIVAKNNELLELYNRLVDYIK